MMKEALCLWVVVTLLMGAFAIPAGAGDGPKSPLQTENSFSAYSGMQPYEHDDGQPPGELIIADSIFLRPLGLVAMGVGFVGSILTFPWAASSGSFDRVCTQLIEKPYKYTFERPVGEVDY